MNVGYPELEYTDQSFLFIFGVAQFFYNKNAFKHVDF